MKRMAQDGCVCANGLNYLAFFDRLHQTVKPDWYLEIGTQTGASLAFSTAKSIAVDPVFRLRQDVVGQKPALYSFQETSDAFFEAGRLKQLGAKIDLAFLDGMHLFEYLLRDFIGTEKHASKDGLILLHDCLPWNVAMTARQRGQAETSSWTGDVWKLVPILQKYRPDLTLEIVDAAPTGLVIVTGLNPASRVLEKNYDAILEEFLDINLGDYGVERYFSSFEILSAQSCRWMSEFPLELGKGWDKNPDICIKIAAPSQAKMMSWGDYHFARGLARAFSRMGHCVSIASQENWNQITTPGGIDLVLRGRAQVSRIPGRYCLFWSISKSMRDMNYDQADHVFWASPVLMQEEIKGRGKGISTLLPQAFDATVMTPGTSKTRKDIVFVGRSRAGQDRKAVQYAAAAGEDVKIWGPGWRDGPYDRFVVADGAANADVPAIYQSAEIVLNDHTSVMTTRGLLSNRVFDALACGAIPVSEDVGWLPDDIAEFVYTFHDQKSFEAALKKARSETATKRKARDALARKLSAMHSFDARAEVILDTVAQLEPGLAVAAE
ncbi:glycosyltransferase [uncultured Marivita sp.]|uniref:glycosyltransferase family protein n=1 Tax=uncultured Marivita sp. TaxID=888080 RepID=UPI0026395C85|nr:glycosyltransferase [uncultured Marivita sp.]